MLEALLIILGVISLFAIILLYGTFAWGFVLYKFWGWFLLPVFPLLPQISIVQAVGISFVIALFGVKTMTIIKEEYRKKAEETLASFLSPFIVFVFGWLFKIIFLG